MDDEDIPVVICTPAQTFHLFFACLQKGACASSLCSLCRYIQLVVCCRGKTAATYQPSMDMGSYVVVINAEKVVVTGNKEQQKMYYRHTGRPGSLKQENFKKLQAVREMS